MASRFLPGASALALLLVACSGSGPENSSDSASSHTQIETGGRAGSGSVKGNAHAGAAGHASTRPNQNATGGSAAEPAGTDPGMENAGLGGAGGDPGEPPPPCDLEGNCSSEGDGVQVTCGVEPWFQCEFSGFVGATAQVGQGQRAVIGTACCGACDCVPVEVYYDGAKCWQGVPQCDGELHKPHAPTTPNPTFTVPTDVYGTFHLGSGGYGGSADPAGQAGGGGGSSSAGGTVTQGEAGALITPEG